MKAIHHTLSTEFKELQILPLADIHSHTHLPAIVKPAYFRPSLANNSVMKVDRLFINTSSTLEYGGYGEAQAYKPNSTDTPMIILDGSKRGMRAVL